jgi:excisionase family DNA binding protein
MGSRTKSNVQSKTEGVAIDKPLLTINEVANLLGISKFTVYRMLKDGEIQATKLRGSIRIFGDALEKYIFQNII